MRAGPDWGWGRGVQVISKVLFSRESLGSQLTEASEDGLKLIWTCLFTAGRGHSTPQGSYCCLSRKVMIDE